MTRKAQKSIPKEVRSLLDQFLEGRSDGFKAKVYELVVRYGWDVNDPSFAILVSTGQMEVLLEQFPAEFESKFVDLMQKAQLQFEGHRQWWAERQEELNTYLQGVEVQQSGVMEKLQAERVAFEESATTQREWVLGEIKAVLTVSKQEKDQFYGEMVKRLRREQTQLIMDAQDQSTKLVKKGIILGEKRAAKDVFVWGGVISGVVGLIGIVFGIMLHNSVQQRFTDVPWAMQLWDWNQGFYRECKKLKRTTCNFRIVEPEEK